MDSEAAKNTPVSNYNWPGMPAPREELTCFLKQIIEHDFVNGRQHYAFATPGVMRPFPAFFKLRICWMMELEGEKRCKSAFDGAVESRRLRQGDMLITASNAIPEDETESDLIAGFTVAFHTQHVRLNYTRRIKGSYQKISYYHTLRPASGVLALLVDALDIVIHDINGDRQERCKALIRVILPEVLRHVESEKNVVDTSIMKRVMQIKKYMDHNYFRNINCSSISKALNINRTYASGIFKKAFNESMQTYLQNLRLDAACNMLASEENIEIQNVARSCGFASRSYFIKVFHKKYGISPGAYRLKKSVDRL